MIDIFVSYIGGVALFIVPAMLLLSYLTDKILWKNFIAGGLLISILVGIALGLGDIEEKQKKIIQPHTYTEGKDTIIVSTNQQYIITTRLTPR